MLQGHLTLPHCTFVTGQQLSFAGTQDQIDFQQKNVQDSCSVMSGNESFPVFPISFSIPKEHCVAESDALSVKRSRNFAAIIPGKQSTYIFQTQKEYYEGYKISMFGITFKKGGWDCLRHLEIIANGCMPYMLDAKLLPFGTMFRWPKDVLNDVLNLGGIDHAAVQEMVYSDVDPLQVDDAKLVNSEQFNTTLFLDLLNGLQAHVRKYLTTEAMAKYLMSLAYDIEIKNILFVGSPNAATHTPDYLACTLFHGMRSLFGSSLVDFPKRTWMYSNYKDDKSSVYGHGFTYAFLLDDIPIDREHIQTRLQSGEFSHVIFAVTHNGLDQALLDSVSRNFRRRQIFFIDGSDLGISQTESIFTTEMCLHVGTCLSRELKCE